MYMYRYIFFHIQPERDPLCTLCNFTHRANSQITQISSRDHSEFTHISLRKHLLAQRIHVHRRAIAIINLFLWISKKPCDHVLKTNLYVKTSSRSLRAMNSNWRPFLHLDFFFCILSAQAALVKHTDNQMLTRV